MGAMWDLVGHLEPMEVALAQLMSDLSETAYCAGWHKGTEWFVWRLLVEGGTFGQVDVAQVATLLRAIAAVSEAADAWIVWDDVDDDPKAVPLDEWKARYEAGPPVPY